MRAMLIAACVAASSSCASPTTPPPPAEPVNGFLQIVEPVANGIHVMRQAQVNYAGVVGNVSIIEQTNGIVLVDSGSSYGDGARVVAAVRALSRKPVTAVIITHWHNDHPLGLAAIVEAWPGVSIIATEATRVSLEGGRTNVPLQPDTAWEGRRRDQFQGYVTQLTPQTQDPALSQQEREGWARAISSLAIRERDVAGTHVVLPTRTFTESITLEDRRTPIEIRFEGRANTDGDAIVWLPRQRILIAGDTIVWPIPYNFSMYPADNIATLQRLRAYDYALLIPGHGEVQHDKGYLDLLIDFTTAAREAVGPLARNGATLEQVTAQVRLESFAPRFAGSDPWALYWFENYARAPLIESAFNEARGEPLGPPALTP